MDELRVETHLTTGEIACNFDDLETALAEQMQAYAGLEVTEDNMAERRKDVAALRKFKDALDTRRKAVKTEFSKPLKDFEERVKKLTGIVDKEIDRINADLDVFEQKRREEKKAHIADLYKTTCGGYEEYVTLPAIYNSRWENKMCGDNEIISEMQEHVLKVKTDLSAIKGLRSDIEDELISDYKAHGQLTSVIAKDAMYRDAKVKAEERARSEAEAAKKKAEEAQRVTVDVAAMSETSFNDRTAVAYGPTLTIRVHGQEDIDAVKMFLKMSEIQYEEVRG